MGDYKINIVNLNVTNNYVELTAELEGDRELYYPRISACFYGENDNRILPMDLKSCNKNKAIAIGIFDTPFLFYNNRKSQNVRVNEKNLFFSFKQQKRALKNDCYGFDVGYVFAVSQNESSA